MQPTTTLVRRERTFAILLFLIGLLLYFVVNFHRVAIPGQIFSQLQHELQLSAAGVAGLGAAFMYAYAAVQLLVGLLVDRYGGMRVLVVGGITMTLGTFLFATATTPLMLYGARLLVGLGCGFVYLSLVKECTRLFSSTFTLMMGFVVFLGYSGGIVGTWPFVRSVASYGWRLSILAVAAISMVLLLLVALLWRTTRHEPVNRKVSLVGRPYLSELRNWNMLKSVVATMTGFGIYYAILTVVGKKMLEDVGGLSSQHASLVCSLMVLLSAICNQLSGLLGGRPGRRRTGLLQWQAGVVPLGSLLALSGLLLAPEAPWLGWFLAAAFTCIMLTSGFAPIVNIHLIHVAAPSMTGVAVGLGNFIAYVLVALWGSLAGGILDFFHHGAVLQADGNIVYPRTAYITLFAIFLLVSGVAWLISLRLPETYSANIHNGKILPVRWRGRTLFTLHT